MQKSCCSSDDQKQWDLVRPSQKRLGTLSMLAVGWIVFDAEAADYISLAGLHSNGDWQERRHIKIFVQLLLLKYRGNSVCER
jgi:hypothetical protein